MTVLDAVSLATNGNVSIVTIILILFLLICFARVINRKSRLSDKALEIFKKVPSVPVLGPCLHLIGNANDYLRIITDWQLRFGPCWRLKIFGWDIVAIHEPQYLKVILESRDFGCLQKSLVYNLMLPGPLGAGLLNRKPDVWEPRRKALNRLFTYDSLKNYVPILKRHGDLLVQEIGHWAENKSPSNDYTNYGKLIHFKALDIIGEICTGTPFQESLGRDTCQQFHQNLETYLTITTQRLYKQPWTLLPFLWHFHPTKKILDKCISHLSTLGEKIRQTYEPQRECRFAVDLMMEENWSNQEITEEILTLMVAGHETTSSAFTMHLWNLALEQDYQTACQREIDNAIDRLDSSGAEFSITSVNELELVERCVKETLRLYPVLGCGTARALKTRVNFGPDVYLEPGTVMLYVPYLLHRNPRIYSNPEMFDPDRFLPENAKQRSPYAYLPFSAGPRNCIGWKVALLELKVLTAVILRNFNLSTTDKREDIKISAGFVMTPDRQPNIIFTRRNF